MKVRDQNTIGRVAKIAPAWLHRKLSNRQFLMVGAVIVGLWAGLTAVVLKISVHSVEELLMPVGRNHPWIYFVSPTVGIFLSVLFVQFVLNGSLLRGTSHVLLAIARKSSFIPRNEIYGHVATSALTVGMGGSAGLESPIVQTGSAIGSVFASFFPIGYRDRTLLLACGASAGIATAFNAPIAGVLFALEVLLVDVSISAFIPLLIAGATGALCSKIILDENILFTFKNASEFNYRNVPYYVLLGVLCGLVSAFYLKTFLKAEQIFRKVPSKLLKAILGGVLLGLLIMLFPALFGEGYSSIKALAHYNPKQLLNGSPLFPFLSEKMWALGFAILAIALIKSIAVAVTLGGGGNGGNFAPSLLSGACVGFSFSYLFNLTGFSALPTSNFSLVGMAGMLTGIFHAPLTAIFLIAEITGGYDLIIPLMIVSAISTALSGYMHKDSLDQAKLRMSPEAIVLDKDTRVLSELSVSGFIEKDFISISPAATLRTLTEAVAHSKRNFFPVVTEDGKLAGIVSLENIREVMFDSVQYDILKADQLMQLPQVTADIDENMATVMEKFDKSGLWNIPVLASGKYVGFISKSSIFSNYRNRLRTS